MKKIIYSMIAVAFFSGISGCHWFHQNCNSGCNNSNSCQSCGVLGNLASKCGHHRAVRPQPAPSSPPTATVGYPYYTHRGPRDFFMSAPLSLGP